MAFMEKFDLLIDDLSLCGWDKTEDFERQHSQGMSIRTWTLISTWSPVGLCVTLDFLGDPQLSDFPDERTIWGVEIRKKETSHGLSGTVVNAGRHWDRRRAEIVETVNSFRTRKESEEL